MTSDLPRAYGGPWEEVLHARKPLEVSLTTVPFKSNGQAYLSINQGLWRLVACNPAAQALLDLDVALLATASRDGSGDRVYDWALLIEPVLAAYDQGPEFEVRFGSLPSFRLRLGTKKSTVIAKLARRRLAGLHPGLLRYFSSTLDALGVMHQFAVEHGPLPPDFEGAVGVTYSRWFIERLPAQAQQ